MPSLRSRAADLYGGRDPAEVPAYLITEAAHYLRLPVSTVRAWTLGQEGFRAVISIADRKAKLLSFRNLVELHLLSAIRRQHHVKMSAVRRAVKFLREQFNIDHPLAYQRMLTDGTGLFVERYDELVNVSASGQMEMKAILEAYLERIEWDPQGIPIRLFPFTTTNLEAEQRQIVIDPRIQFGRPCIQGTGVPTAIIAERFAAGDSIEDLADDYGTTPDKVQAAIRCEFDRRAA